MNNTKKNKELYEAYVVKYGLSIFYKPWYLDAVCSSENWDVAIAKRDGNTIGVWPFYKKKMYLFSTITQPILTSYLGPHVIKLTQSNKNLTQLGFDKKVLTELSQKLPKVSRFIAHGHPTWINWQPLSWLGYEQTTRYTYRLDLTKDEETLFSQLSDKTRNQIKKAKTLIEIIEGRDANDIFDLFSYSYDRQHLTTPFTKGQFKNLYTALLKHESTKTYFAQMEKKKVAVVCNVYDRDTSYLLLTGQTDDKISGSVSLLIWRSILEAKSKGCKIFDFEGSMIAGIESFFRSFGGDQVPYHKIVKTSNKLYYLLFKLLNKL